MSWTNYLYNEKLNIAIEIGKTDYNDIDEDLEESLIELIEYMEREEKDLQVILYLWNKIYVYDTMGILVSLFIKRYVRYWKIIHEDEVPKEVKLIMRN